MSVDGGAVSIGGEWDFSDFFCRWKMGLLRRDRKLIVRYSLESGVEEQIFPPVGSPFNRYQVAKPRVSADGERVFFISDRGGRWQVWGAELRTGKAVHVGRGCEPTLSDGELLLWVTNGWWGGKTSLITRSLATGRTIKFARPSSAGEFEYYPSFVDGGRRFLVRTEVCSPPP